MRRPAVAVLDGVGAPARAARVRPRGASRRERWLRRLPLLPGLPYLVAAPPAPFAVNDLYRFPSLFCDLPGDAHFTRLCNYPALFTVPPFRRPLPGPVLITPIA